MTSLISWESITSQSWYTTGMTAALTGCCSEQGTRVILGQRSNSNQVLQVCVFFLP